MRSLPSIEIYRQIDRVAIDSLLGPLQADVFMAKLKHSTLRSYRDEVKM